jgi:hypothetical protein
MKKLSGKDFVQKTEKGKSEEYCLMKRIVLHNIAYVANLFGLSNRT